MIHGLARYQPRSNFTRPILKKSFVVGYVSSKCILLKLRHFYRTYLLCFFFRMNQASCVCLPCQHRTPFCDSVCKSLVGLGHHNDAHPCWEISISFFPKNTTMKHQIQTLNQQVFDDHRVYCGDGNLKGRVSVVFNFEPKN